MEKKDEQNMEGAKHGEERRAKHGARKRVKYSNRPHVYIFHSVLILIISIQRK